MVPNKSPECFVGKYQEYKPECLICKFADECKRKRQKIRHELSRIISKSGTRKWLQSSKMARGDLMLSHPNDIVSRLFALFEELEEVYGVTNRGLTGLVDKDLYKKAVQAEVDLHMYNTAMKKWDTSRNDEEYDIEVVSPLRELEKKYGKLFKVDLTQKPAQLLRYMLLYIKIELVPEMKFTIDNVSSLLVSDDSSNGEPKPDYSRFRKIDSGPHEKK